MCLVMHSSAECNSIIFLSARLPTFQEIYFLSLWRNNTTVIYFKAVKFQWTMLVNLQMHDLVLPQEHEFTFPLLNFMNFLLVYLYNLSNSF